MKPGTIFAKNYLVEELLGTGGFARVYRATEMELERPVALKVMLPRESAPGEPYRVLKERFFREARYLSKLQEPQTVRLYDYGEADGQRLYMALEFVEGRNLREILRQEGKQPLVQAAEVLRQVLLGLREVHSLGVLHRDVKPGNVLVFERFGEVRAKLLDFGIAKSLSPAHEELTQSGFVVGTPRYLAPEQITGRELTPATDIYAVGLILYEMLIGEQPFKDADITQILDLKADYKRLLSVVDDSRPPLRHFLNHCVDPNPEKRFQSAQEALDELARMRVLLEQWDETRSATGELEEVTRQVEVYTGTGRRGEQPDAEEDRDSDEPVPEVYSSVDIESQSESRLQNETDQGSQSTLSPDSMARALAARDLEEQQPQPSSDSRLGRESEATERSRSGIGSRLKLAVAALALLIGGGTVMVFIGNDKEQDVDHSPEKTAGVLAPIDDREARAAEAMLEAEHIVGISVESAAGEFDELRRRYRAQVSEATGEANDLLALALRRADEKSNAEQEASDYLEQRPSGTTTSGAASVRQPERVRSGASSDRASETSGQRPPSQGSDRSPRFEPVDRTAESIDTDEGDESEGGGSGFTVEPVE